MLIDAGTGGGATTVGGFSGVLAGAALFTDNGCCVEEVEEDEEDEVLKSNPAISAFVKDFEGILEDSPPTFPFECWIAAIKSSTCPLRFVRFETRFSRFFVETMGADFDEVVGVDASLKT